MNELFKCFFLLHKLFGCEQTIHYLFSRTVFVTIFQEILMWISFTFPRKIFSMHEMALLFLVKITTLDIVKSIFTMLYVGRKLRHFLSQRPLKYHFSNDNVNYISFVLQMCYYSVKAWKVLHLESDKCRVVYTYLIIFT